MMSYITVQDRGGVEHVEISGGEGGRGEKDVDSGGKGSEGGQGGRDP